MKLDVALGSFKSAFIDSAVIIYFVETHPRYAKITQAIFERISNQLLQAMTSPITLAECLVVPQRNHDADMIEAFTQLITSGVGVTFISIGQMVAEQASILRSEYKLGLPDALQLAVSLVSSCDVFLTNDARLKRVNEVHVLLLDELEL